MVYLNLNFVALQKCLFFLNKILLYQIGWIGFISCFEIFLKCFYFENCIENSSYRKKK